MKSCLKWHGGKAKLATWIISKFTPHTHYVEPFAGALHVLFAKPFEGYSEVVNDRHGELMNFWRCLADRASRDEMISWLTMMPFSRDLFDYCAGIVKHKLPTDNPVLRAAAFFVFARQSMAGRLQGWAPLSKRRTRRGMNEQACEWMNVVDLLPQCADRLRRVVLECDDATRIIEREDTDHTLFYCDPPYLQSTRTKPDVYTHEMTEQQHAELLRVLKRCKGAVLLSGYRSELYDRELSGWKRWELDVACDAAGGSQKASRTECLWSNRP